MWIELRWSIASAGDQVLVSFVLSEADGYRRWSFFGTIKAFKGSGIWQLKVIYVFIWMFCGSFSGRIITFDLTYSAC